MTGGSFKYYWQTNPSWYYYDENKHLHLTEDAPEKAKESFKAFTEWAKQREERRNAIQ